MNKFVISVGEGKALAVSGFAIRMWSIYVTKGRRKAETMITACDALERGIVAAGRAIR